MQICNHVMDTASLLGDLTTYDGNGKLAELYPTHVNTGVIKLGSTRHDFKCNVTRLLTTTKCLIEAFNELTDTEFRLDVTKLKSFICSLGYKESAKRALMSSINQLIRKHSNDPSRYQLSLSILKLDEAEKHKVFKRDRQRVLDANCNVIMFKQPFLERYIKQYKTLREYDTKNTNELARLCIVALAAAGLRFEELFSQTYTYSVDAESDTVLHQSNVAKNRGDARPLYKPLVGGMSAIEFQNIRQTIISSTKTKKQIQAIVGLVISMDFPVDFLTPNDTINMTAHKLRRTYAVMSQAAASQGLYGAVWQTRAISSTGIGWSMLVLGHNDLSGSLSSINFKAETPTIQDEQVQIPVDDDVVIEHSLKRKRDSDEGDLEYDTFKRELRRVDIAPSGDRFADMCKYAALLQFKIQNK